jgi:hypothetical protein
MRHAWIIVALFAACAQPQSGAPAPSPVRAGGGAGAPLHDWAIDIKTEGGITGRGLGNATLSAATVANCDHATLDDALARARPEHWARRYADPNHPNGSPDAVLTTMTLTIDGKSATTSWYGPQRSLVPPDALALFDAGWALRSCGR